MPHATMPATGFQAIILCGPGEGLNPFNSNPNDFPKALVPIANRPMVWYSLEWCYRMGVTNIHLVAPPESRSALDAALSQNPHLTSLCSPKPSIIAPEGLTLTTGTAEIFRLPEVQDAILGDFIVLPCDIVCELNGLALLESWMTLQKGLGSWIDTKSRTESASQLRIRRGGGLGVWYQTKDSAEDGVGVMKEETDFVALNQLPLVTVPAAKASLRPHIYNLAMSMPKAALQDDMEEKQAFFIRHALLKKHGKVKMKMTYRDAHIYFLPYWAKDLMRKNETFESLSEDAIGMWAKAGWQDGLAKKLSFHKIFDQDRKIDVSRQGQSSQEIDIEKLSSTFAGTSTLVDNSQRDKAHDVRFASRVLDAPSTSSVNSEIINVPPILSYNHPAQPAASLLRRIDTVPLLLSASLSLARLPSALEANATGAMPSSFAHTHKIPPTTVIPPQLTIHEPSVLIDANVTLTPKSTIRDSVIGSNCVLGTPGNTEGGVRLSRCLLMEGVTIESRNVMNGCVLGRRCRIGAGCDLRDCYVQEGYLVPPGTLAKGEVFAGFDEGGDAVEDEASLYDDNGEADEDSFSGDAI